jgi:hypothetical protein
MKASAALMMASSQGLVFPFHYTRSLNSTLNYNFSPAEELLFCGSTQILLGY